MWLAKVSSFWIYHSWVTPSTVSWILHAEISIWFFLLRISAYRWPKVYNSHIYIKHWTMGPLKLKKNHTLVIIAILYSLCLMLITCDVQYVIKCLNMLAAQLLSLQKFDFVENYHLLFWVLYSWWYSCVEVIQWYRKQCCINTNRKSNSTRANF